MTADLLDEAERRAIALSKSGPGRHLFLDYADQAVMGLLLEIIAEAVTEQDRRLQAAERETAEARQEADRLRCQIASMKSGIAALQAAATRTHPE